MQCKQCLPAVAALMLALAAIGLACGQEVSPRIACAVPVILASRYCGFSMGAAYSVIAWLTARLSNLERILRALSA